ncbi:MAG: NAD(P)-dependent glycerol-3-phosphate dehydrogenase [Gammaproteobacteria bacterium]|nr:NAD(P)-dependent glycerol-3-phosphate dehydrogenase [Gammaproteobacteria bacterium]
MTKTPVLVAGAGSWGTALAIVLARNNHPVFLWGHNLSHIQQLQQLRCNNRYLPDITFPENLEPVDDLQSQLNKIRDIVIAVPCSGLRDVLNILAGSNKSDLKICLACKGLASGIQLLNHQIVSEYLGSKATTAVLSGPSFAAEVAHGLPTAVTIASNIKTTAEYFAKCFHNEVFRTYTHDDIIGVQIGGAIKNVMAIAAGIADGLGFGANTRAALITRGLVEIIRLGVALGGRQETFMGLAGLGDLVLTCTDNRSRNRRLGLAMGKGTSLDVASRQIGQVIEGVRTASEAMKLAAKYNIEMPISEQVYKVLSGQITPRDAVQALLSREPKEEMD